MFFYESFHAMCQNYIQDNEGLKYSMALDFFCACLAPRCEQLTRTVKIYICDDIVLIISLE